METGINIKSYGETCGRFLLLLILRPGYYILKPYRLREAVMRVLAVIDMQRDFIDGVLGTKEAKAILPAVVKKIEEY